MAAQRHSDVVADIVPVGGTQPPTPNGKQRLRDEVTGLGHRRAQRSLQPRQSGKKKSRLCRKWAFKEACAKKPPVPSISRAAGGARTSPQGFCDPRRHAGSAFNPLLHPFLCGTYGRSATVRPDAFHRDEATRKTANRFCWVRSAAARGAYVPRAEFRYMQAKTFARHFLQNLKSRLLPGPATVRTGRMLGRSRSGATELRVVINRLL